MRSGGRELTSTAVAYAVYATSVLPRVDAERRRWLERARTIPDRSLRGLALSALEDKAGNVEATAVFAILAPRRLRPRVVTAGAALQIAVDYLDSVDEARGGELADRLRLHGALTAAFDPKAGPPLADDGGGYLAELLSACSAAAAPLPHFADCAPLLRGAIARCGEGQAHTHTAAAGDSLPLRAWAEGLPAPPGYGWWEAAAGASSSVAAHALLAVAADPDADADEPALVDAAYFPSIGALTVLLDDLVDFARDAAAGDHNYVSHYADADAAAARLGLIADRATAAIAPLRHGPRHSAILAGVAAFYLSERGARTPGAEPIRRRLLESLGPSVRLLGAAIALRRRAQTSGA